MYVMPEKKRKTKRVVSLMLLVYLLKTEDFTFMVRSHSINVYYKLIHMTSYTMAVGFIMT